MTSSFMLQARRVVEACVLGVVVASSGAIAGEARGARREKIIEDIAPPTREGFEAIVVQMPPLVPMRRKTQAPALSAALSTAEPKAAARTPVDSPEAEQGANATQAPAIETSGEPHLRSETPPIGVASRDLHGSPQPIEAASTNVPPEVPSEPPRETARAEETPLMETATPAPGPESVASENDGQGALIEAWQWIVVALASAGLLISRLRRESDESAPSHSAEVKKLRRFVKAAQSKITSILEARAPRAVIAWREKFALPPVERSPAEQAEGIVESSADAQRSTNVNGPPIATTSHAEGEAANGGGNAASATRAGPDFDGWGQPDHDRVELLEPGAAGTQAIIMNARRKLRAAQG